MRLERFTWILPVAGVAIVFACTEPGSNPGRIVGTVRRDASTSPELLVCPSDTTTQSAPMTIGVLGGTLAFGGNSITIPANAVTVPTDFQIVVPASKHMKVKIHAVGQSSFLFRQPVQVTIDYSRCPAGAAPQGAALQGVYVDSTDSVLQQMGGVVDSAADQVTFTTGHLSGYAVAY